MQYTYTLATIAAVIGAASAQDAPNPTDPALLSDLAALSSIFASISEQLSSEGDQQMSILPVETDAVTQSEALTEISVPAFLPSTSDDMSLPAFLPTTTGETPSETPSSEGAVTPAPTPTETGAASAVGVAALWAGVPFLGMLGLL